MSLVSWIPQGFTKLKVTEQLIWEQWVIRTEVDINGVWTIIEFPMPDDGVPEDDDGLEQRVAKAPKTILHGEQPFPGALPEIANVYFEDPPDAYREKSRWKKPEVDEITSRRDYQDLKAKVDMVIPRLSALADKQKLGDYAMAVLMHQVDHRKQSVAGMLQEMFQIGRTMAYRYMETLGEAAPELFPSIVGRRESQLAVLLPGQAWRDAVKDVKKMHEEKLVRVALEVRASLLGKFPLDKWSVFSKHTGLPVGELQARLREAAEKEARVVLNSALKVAVGNWRPAVKAIDTAFHGPQYAVASRMLAARIRGVTVSDSQISRATGLAIASVRDYRTIARRTFASVMSGAGGM
jgi:hypothetical protein